MQGGFCGLAARRSAPPTASHSGLPSAGPLL